MCSRRTRGMQRSLFAALVVAASVWLASTGQAARPKVPEDGVAELPRMTATNATGAAPAWPGHSAEGPAPVSNAAQNTTSAPAATNTPGPIHCTANGEGITFSVEKCNKTNKTILKVTVRDSFRAEKLPEEPTATEPAPETTESTEHGEDTEYQHSVDYDYDYDYSPPVPPHSLAGKAARNFLEEERRREFAPFGPPSEQTTTTTTTLPPPVAIPFFRRPRPRPRGPDWTDFCNEAEQEKEEAFRVPDGTFHPDYEAAVGFGFYRFHATPRTWEQARRKCESEGAHLAIPNSRGEANKLAEFHNRCGLILPSHFNDYQYLGAHDMFSEGDWITVLGDSLNETGYVSWASNQPDNAHHNGENCLSMNRYGHYNDIPCIIKLPFTCEILS